MPYGVVVQWLFDSILDYVLSKIPAYQGYVDRGDPSAWDYVTGMFSPDGAWHEMDLSAIVPPEAVAICFELRMQVTGAGRYIQFRKKGNVNTYNVSIHYTQASNAVFTCDGIVSLSEDKKIEYLMTPYIWTGVFFLVKGWFAKVI